MIGIHVVGGLALYLLLATLLGWGLWLVWVCGDNLFGVLQILAYDPGNRAPRREVMDMHMTLAHSVVVLAGLHAVLALVRHCLKRGGVLQRMLPGPGWVGVVW